VGGAVGPTLAGAVGEAGGGAGAEGRGRSSAPEKTAEELDAELRQLQDFYCQGWR